MPAARHDPDSSVRRVVATIQRDLDHITQKVEQNSQEIAAGRWTAGRLITATGVFSTILFAILGSMGFFFSWQVDQIVRPLQQDRAEDRAQLLRLEASHTNSRVRQEVIASDFRKELHEIRKAMQ